ncbi:MAG: dehydratase [Planctomycetes bacterium]|nr:dehydratase [Planctomycetota bacterium]
MGKGELEPANGQRDVDSTPADTRPAGSCGADSLPVEAPLWFEDLVLGRTFRSATRTITAADIAAFSRLSGDHNPLHTDEELARKSTFRGTVAHGHLVQSVASGLAWDLGIFRGTLVALKGIEITFVAPVRPDTELCLELTVSELDQEPRPRRGLVVFGARVLDGAEELVIEGRWTTIMARRPKATS